MPVARREFREPWREQWARTERWYARLLALQEGGTDDFALVVLQHCWAMHDWMIRSKAFVQRDVEVLFQDPAMRLCRDVANGLKHLDLGKPGFDADFRVVRAYHPRFENGEEKPGSRSVVLAGGGAHDLVELCRTCMERIRAFIVASGKLLPNVSHLA